jgi:NADH-quinone oxidoreductase subunit K
MSFIIFFSVSTLTFFFGLCGVFSNRKNILLTLMSVELTLLAINFNFLVVSSYVDDRFGQIFSIFILSVAAAESAVGLAILVIYFRNKGNFSLDQIKTLKG